jgi:cytochrome P450
MSEPAGEDVEMASDAETRLTDQSVLADPKAFCAALREERRIRFDAGAGGYLVAHHDQLSEVLSDPVTYSMELAWERLWSDDFKDIMARDGGGWFPDAIMTDPPNHTRIRRLMEKAFTPHRIKQLEPLITARTVAMIEKYADDGRFDGVTDFALPLTIGLMAEQLGMTDVDPVKIDRWATAVIAQIGRMLTPEQMIENARIVCECQQFVIEMVKERQQTPTEDLISDLVHARNEDGGDVLDFGELVASARAFLIGGNDSIASAISNMLYLLATRSDLAEQLHASLDDDRFVTRWVEELLRFMPPTRGNTRVTTRDVELDGQAIPKGSTIITLFGSANEDEAQFPSAESFDINRPNLARHMSFGAGAHRCVGLALARMELKVVAREVSRRLTDIRLDIDPANIPYKSDIATLTMKRLPLTFRRREAA